MKKKAFFTLLVIILSETVCFGGELDVWVSSINGEWIYPVKELVAFPGDVLGIDVIYLNEPGYYLFGLSSVLYIKGCGIFDISEVVWNPAFDDPFFRGIENVGGGVKMGGVAGIGKKGVPSEGKPLIVLENIKIRLTGSDFNIIYLLDYAPWGGSLEIDYEWNTYEVYYGYGTRIYNCGIPPWPADLNCNYEVNFEDFTIFAQSWNSSFPEDNYNPNCDLALSDGYIGFKDLLEFVNYWLEEPLTYP